MVNLMSKCKLQNNNLLFSIYSAEVLRDLHIIKANCLRNKKVLLSTFFLISCRVSLFHRLCKSQKAVTSLTNPGKLQWHTVCSVLLFHVIFTMQFHQDKDPIHGACLIWIVYRTCVHADEYASLFAYTFENRNLFLLCSLLKTPMSLPAKKPSEVHRFGSQLALSSEQDALSLTSHNTHRLR